MSQSVALPVNPDANLLEEIWRRSPSLFKKFVLKKSNIAARSVYVDFPYNSTSESELQFKVQVAKSYALRLLSEDLIPVIPLVLMYDLLRHASEKERTNVSALMWKELCFSKLDTCDEVRIITFPGFGASDNVKDTITRAMTLGIYVRYVHLASIIDDKHN